MPKSFGYGALIFVGSFPEEPHSKGNANCDQRNECAEGMVDHLRSNDSSWQDRRETLPAGSSRLLLLSRS
jgi:hypothetical protein